MTAARERPGALDLRFIMLWMGQLLSGLGSGMTGFALGVYAFQVTGTVTSFSMVVLALFVPSILLKPIGGVLTDQFNRKRLIIVGDLGAALSVLALITVVADAAPAFWKVYLLVGSGSAFGALREPAYKASITDLVTEDQFSRAGGLVQLAASAQHLLAPLCAGVLMSAGVIGTVLLIDLATFLAAITATLVITVSEQLHRVGGTPGWFGRDMREGWSVITRDPIVIRIVTVISAVTIFVGFMQTLLHPKLLLVTGPGTVGAIQSLASIGMIGSCLILGVVAVTRRHDRMLFLGLTIAGAGMSLVGWSSSIVVSGVALFIFFAALPLINTSAEVLIRSRIPNDLQGRAWGIIGFLSQIGYIVAFASAGVLVDRVFKPLFVSGAGPGREIGFMLGISGLSLSALAIPILNLRGINMRGIEEQSV